MDRRPNVKEQPVPQEDAGQTRASRAAREQGAANEALRHREDGVNEESGGVGYTEEGKDVDRVERVEEH